MVPYPLGNQHYVKQNKTFLPLLSFFLSFYFSQETTEMARGKLSGNIEYQIYSFHL